MHAQGLLPVPSTGSSSALVVGHYCHDTLFLRDRGVVETLGGSVAYIVPLLRLLGLQACVVSKVGSDFQYTAQVLCPPIVLQDCSTTQFFAHWQDDGGRLLTAGEVCKPIVADDLQFDDEQKFEIGLAVGIAGEILPSTLKRLAQLSRRTVVDLQALIRVINPGAEVRLQRLEETPFFSLLPFVSYLKASSCEAAFFDPRQCSQHCEAVIITNGSSGCTIFTRDGSFEVVAFPSTEVDATGAGDTFLAAFVAGLCKGLDLYRAALMGNYFGSIAVSQIGVPKITPEHVQGWARALSQCSAKEEDGGRVNTV